VISTADLADVLSRGVGGYVDPDLPLVRAEMRKAMGLGAPLSLTSIAGSLVGQAGSALTGLVQQVTFRSNVTPDISWQPGQATQPGAPGTPPEQGPGFLESLVQPAIDIDVQGQRYTIAPAGEPTVDYELVVGGVVVGGALLAGGLLWGAFELGKRSGRRSGSRKRVAA
jgi:hypothetical protein